MWLVTLLGHRLPKKSRAGRPETPEQIFLLHKMFDVLWYYLLIELCCDFVFSGRRPGILKSSGPPGLRRLRLGASGPPPEPPKI
jgi:hypothetical protein